MKRRQFVTLSGLTGLGAVVQGNPVSAQTPAPSVTSKVRVLGTVEGMTRFVDIAASPYHGLNLRIGRTAEMLQNPNREIHDVIRDFGGRQEIFTHGDARPSAGPPRRPTRRSGVRVRLRLHHGIAAGGLSVAPFTASENP